MRKSEPDSKYFGQTPENEVFPDKTDKNRPKHNKLFTVSFAKDLTISDTFAFGTLGTHNFQTVVSSLIF